MKRIVLAGLASLIAPTAEAQMPIAVPVVRQVQGGVPVSQLVQGATKKGDPKGSVAAPREDKHRPEMKDSAAKGASKAAPAAQKSKAAR